MTAPVLTPRAAREQRAFRTMLDCMARPGQIGSMQPHERGGQCAGAVTILESVLDHEVSFAVVPEAPDVVDTLLRFTGSRSTEPAQADFILASEPQHVAAVEIAKLGSFEYPDRNATVLLLVSDLSAAPNGGLGLVLRGPGIRDTSHLWVTGLSMGVIPALRERNAGAPMGIDVVLITPHGQVACLPRYTRIETPGAL